MAGELFAQLESQYGLPPGLLDSVWAAESARGRAMLSPAGAQGHFGFMPATARQYGLTDPNDLGASASAAARMYSDLLKQTNGDLPQALAAYNWGIGNLQRKGMEAAPAETRNYIRKVTANMGQPQASGSDSPNADAWAALAAQYGQPQPGNEQAAPKDPWAELNAQFAQPTAPAAPANASPRAQRQAQEQQEPLRSGKNVARMATAAIPVVGPMLAMMDTNTQGLARGVASGFADIGNTLLNHEARVRAELERPAQRNVSGLVTGPQGQRLPRRSYRLCAMLVASTRRRNPLAPWPGRSVTSGNLGSIRCSRAIRGNLSTGWPSECTKLDICPTTTRLRS